MKETKYLKSFIEITENLNISDDDSYTITCHKCKSIEDTFTKNEKPEDYGWLLHRNKWYCLPCSHNFKIK